MRWNALTWTALLTLGLVLGCSSSEEANEEEVTAEGVDVEKNPLGALGALASLGSDLEKIQKDLEEMPDVETLHFNDLMAVLPEPPSGYTADDAKGSTNDMGGFKISEVSRVYRAEEGDARVTVTVRDWAYNKALYMPFFMTSKFSQETTEGWQKGITVGEDPGFEKYTTKSQDGERMVLFRKRFPITVDVDNLPAESFDEWWSLINRDELPERQ